MELGFLCWEICSSEALGRTCACLHRPHCDWVFIFLGKWGRLEMIEAKRNFPKKHLLASKQRILDEIKCFRPFRCNDHLSFVQSC